MLNVIGLRARRSGDVGIIRDFAQTLAYVGLRLFMPAVLVLGVTGVWMVLAGDGSFGQLWVLLAVGGFALALAIGVGYLSGVAVELERVASETNASRGSRRPSQSMDGRVEHRPARPGLHGLGHGLQAGAMSLGSEPSTIHAAVTPIAMAAAKIGHAKSLGMPPRARARRSAGS
jgi:hypothetical protein